MSAKSKGRDWFAEAGAREGMLVTAVLALLPGLIKWNTRIGRQTEFNWQPEVDATFVECSSFREVKQPMSGRAGMTTPLPRPPRMTSGASGDWGTRLPSYTGLEAVK